MSSPDSSQPSEPSAPSTAIQLETVTAIQLEENTEASRAESQGVKESIAEAKPTSKYNIKLIQGMRHLLLSLWTLN